MKTSVCPICNKTKYINCIKTIYHADGEEVITCMSCNGEDELEKDVVEHYYQQIEKDIEDDWARKEELWDRIDRAGDYGYDYDD